MQYDVFISYAHNDNMAPQGEYGWVDNFHIALLQYLTGKLGLGRKAKIWRDRTGLRGNVLLNQALTDNVNNSLIFIPILSPNFLASQYCAGELRNFCNQNYILPNGETRIFPIVKYPIVAPPAPLDDSLLKFVFFNIDDFGDMSEELDPSLGGEFRNKFNQKVNDLAREIADFIRRNLTPPAQTPTAVAPIPINPVQDSNISIDAPLSTPPEDVQKIYLAEPSPDLFDKYLEIKRDLEERREQGSLEFEFLPQPLPEDLTQIAQKPADAKQYKEMVRTDTQNSRLTIHLIGKRHNYAPFGSTQTYLDLATEVSAERDGEPNYNRLVWIPKNLYTEEELQQNNDDPHKAFIKKLRQEGVRGDGLMQDSFEEFKSRIIEIVENKPPPPPIVPSDTPWVYVLCDKSDFETVRNLEDLLQNNDFPIFLNRDYLENSPNGDSDISAIEAHNEYLARCDAIMIYWHNARLPWVRKNVFDLQGSKATRNGRRFRFQAVLLDGDLQDKDKTRFRTPPPADLFKLNYSDLSQFLSNLKQNPEGQK